MTVSYSLNVSQATFGGFAKLLFRWKGSIFKSLWRESFLFCTLYVVINATYRHALDQEQKAAFAQVVLFGKYFMDVIPFSFIVGFFVSTVTGRWISQFIELPWPDRTFHVVASFVHGSDDRSRMIRRTLARYTALMQILTYQMVSTAVRKRFPTTQHLVAAGIMTAEERSVYEKVEFAYGKWWLPCHWFTSLATRAKKEGRIKDSILLKGLLEEMFELRNHCAAMIGYDWIGVPLAYTQVATIATYLYALVLLVGTQSIETPKGLAGFTADYYFPFVTVWRFFFSVGWLKVAEQLLNPYGEDDDDFELNWALDRALTMAYDVVDTHHNLHPRVKKDRFWDVKDIRLPQTEHSAKFLKNPELGSAVGLEIEEADYLPIDELCEKDNEEHQYRNESTKKKIADRTNSSFVRRVLNSRIAQSLRRKPLKKAASCSQALSHKHGFYNAAFSIDDDDNACSATTSTHSPPPGARKTSQIHLLNRASPGSKRSSGNFRTKSMNKEKHNSYPTEEAKIANDMNNSMASEDSGVATSEKTAAALNYQLPEVSTDTELAQKDESQESDFEENPEEQGLDVLMPPIPEEASRANSLATNEQMASIAAFQRGQKLPKQMYDRSLDLVAEVSEKLLVLRDTTSAEERWKENEGKGYESCCSGVSSEELSEGSMDEAEDIPTRQDSSKTRQNEEPICITIEQQPVEDSKTREGGQTSELKEV